MGLNRAGGDMYGWVTHVHSHLRGRCPNRCRYCYVRALGRRFPAVRKLYSGPVRLDERELQVPYGKGKTIFVEHLNDIGRCSWRDRDRIATHCRMWPENTYVFQSKIPSAFPDRSIAWPKDAIFGTTIESDRVESAQDRAKDLFRIKMGFGCRTFVTIEPVMDFTVLPFLWLLVWARPDFVAIGADSCRSGLPEPSGERIRELIAELEQNGIAVRVKKNLRRLLEKVEE